MINRSQTSELAMGGQSVGDCSPLIGPLAGGLLSAVERMRIVSSALFPRGPLAGTAVAAVGCPALLLTALGMWPTCSASAQTVTFDFDTGTPVVNVGRSLPFDQTAGGITARFSAISGAFSVQTELSTGYALSQFSGKYLLPSPPRGSALRMQFDRELTDVAFTFATTDYSPTIPTPIVLTAFSVTPTGTNTVGSATARAAYGGDKWPMGTLDFNFGTTLFNRVEVRIQAGGDATFTLDNVTVTLLPELGIRVADTGGVVVSWRWPSTGFVLQQSTDVDSANWTTVTDPVEVVDGQNQVTVLPVAERAFYRLFHA